jgi:hypothetical protein
VNEVAVHDDALSREQVHSASLAVLPAPLGHICIQSWLDLFAELAQLLLVELELESLAVSRVEVGDSL